jgi:hypothetical protein
LRVPQAQPVPFVQIAPRCITPVTVVWANVEMWARAFCDCAKKIRHWAGVSLLLAELVPHQVTSILPLSAAVIHGPMALFVPDPLLMRTGTVNVVAWSRETVRKTR